jgi:hypothetical protein
MNNKFNELTKSMAQPVTRRAALKRFGLGLAGISLARLGFNQAQAITNGVLDANAHPNVGGIVWQVSPWTDVPPPVVCGSGTLIHPRVFLTAGHATYAVQDRMAQGTMTLNNILVSFDSNIFSDGANWRPVSAILTHPGFVPNATSSEDVGVLILRDWVTDIAPLALPPQGFLDAKKASGELKEQSDRAILRVVGYGVVPDSNAGHLTLPPDGLRRFAHPEFQNLHDRWLYTDQNDAHDNGGSCSCDSGGPHFYVDPISGQETLAAVVSRGSPLTLAHDYRVDTDVALNFINHVIAMVGTGQL